MAISKQVKQLIKVTEMYFDADILSAPHNKDQLHTTKVSCSWRDLKSDNEDISDNDDFLLHCSSWKTILKSNKTNSEYLKKNIGFKNIIMFYLFNEQAVLQKTPLKTKRTISK